MIDLKIENVPQVSGNHPDYPKYRVALMIQQVRNELKVGEGRLSPIKFVEQLIKQYLDEGAVAASTWRTYRHYVVQYLRQFRDDEVQIALDLLQAQKVTTGTAAKQKEKEVTAEDLNGLIEHLMKVGQRSDSKYAVLTAAWLTATILTGLRPAEWETAKLYLAGDTQSNRVEIAVLKVDNAKASAERSFGPHRKIHLTSLSPKELSMVVDFHKGLRALLENEGVTFSQVYEGCRQQLIRTSKQLWGAEKSITLYSGRHEFKERASKVLPWEYVCAVMGHKKKRSGTAYGSGGSSVAPKVDANANIALPDPKDVLKVMRANVASEKALEKGLNQSVEPTAKVQATTAPEFG